MSSVLLTESATLSQRSSQFDFENALEPKWNLPDDDTARAPTQDPGAVRLITSFAEKLQQSEPRVTRQNEPLKFAYVEALQRWEGTVLEKARDDFTVRLRDQMHPEAPDEVAVIEYEQLSEADRSLIDVGAVLHWTIGYRTEPHGQKRLTSTIRVRRLQPWSQSQMNRVRTEAQRFDELFAPDA